MQVSHQPSPIRAEGRLCLSYSELEKLALLAIAELQKTFYRDAQWQF